MKNQFEKGYFSALAEKANKTANSAQAKKIRTNLLKYGIIGAVVSGIMVLGGFIGFAISGFNDGFPIGIIISMVVFMLGGVGSSISSMAIRAGLSIVVAGIATDVLDTNQYCPKCNDAVDNDEIYCNKCGHNLRANKLCPCGTQNDINDKFCKSCGKELQ